MGYNLNLSVSKTHNILIIKQMELWYGFFLRLTGRHIMPFSNVP